MSKTTNCRSGPNFFLAKSLQLLVWTTEEQKQMKAAILQGYAEVADGSTDR